METFYRHKLRRYLGNDGGLDSILEYLQQEVLGAGPLRLIRAVPARLAPPPLSHR